MNKWVIVTKSILSDNANAVKIWCPYRADTSQFNLIFAESIFFYKAMDYLCDLAKYRGITDSCVQSFKNDFVFNTKEDAEKYIRDNYLNRDDGSCRPAMIWIEDRHKGVFDEQGS